MNFSDAWFKRQYMSEFEPPQYGGFHTLCNNSSCRAKLSSRQSFIEAICEADLAASDPGKELVFQNM